MNEDKIMSNRLNKTPSRLTKIKRANYSIDYKTKSIKNKTTSNQSLLNKSLDKTNYSMNKKNSVKSHSLINSPKISKKLYFIDEIIQLNKKLYNNQNDVKKTLKDLVGKKKNLTWNIENMCKKGDFENYNKRLENYEEFLFKKVRNTSRVVEDHDLSKGY